ncbi:fe-S metabolism associated domain protein, partial [Chlamydia psittaci 84-8471/1]
SPVSQYFLINSANTYLSEE